MSLTSMLRGKTKEDIQLQTILRDIIEPKPIFVTVSGKKAFSDEYDDLVPYMLSKPYYATLVGTGFDYLARFILARNMEDANVKRMVTQSLASKRGLVYMKSMTDEETYVILVDKYTKGIILCVEFVHNKEPSMDEMCDYIGYFSVLESVSRSGFPPLDIKESLLAATNYEVIGDLKKLGEVFEERFLTSGIMKKDSEIVFNPTFGIGSLSVRGADADIFIDGTIYDFKTTKKKGYNWMECAQVLGYYILNEIDLRCGGIGMGMDKYGEEYQIQRLSFYRARTGEIEILDLKALDEEKLEQGIQKLMKIWGYKSKTD